MNEARLELRVEKLKDFTAKVFIYLHYNIIKHMTKRPNSYRIHYHRYTLQFKFIPELIDRVNEECTDPKKLDGLLNMFIDTEFGIAPDSFRLILV